MNKFVFLFLLAVSMIASSGLLAADTVTFPQDVLRTHTGSGFVAAWDLYAGVKLNDSGDYILSRDEGFLFRTNWTFERYNGSDWNRINVRTNTVQADNTQLPTDALLYRNETVGQSFFNETYHFQQGGGFKLSVYGKTQSAGTFRAKWTFAGISDFQNGTNGLIRFIRNGELWYVDFSDLLNSGYALSLERGQGTFNVTILIGSLNAGDNFTLDPTISSFPYTIGTQGDYYNATGNLTAGGFVEATDIFFNVSANYSFLNLNYPTNTTDFWLRSSHGIISGTFSAILINSTNGALGGNGVIGLKYTQLSVKHWGVFAFYGDSGRNFTIINMTSPEFTANNPVGDASCAGTRIAWFGFCSDNLSVFVNNTNPIRYLTQTPTGIQTPSAMFYSGVNNSNTTIIVWNMSATSLYTTVSNTSNATFFGVNGGGGRVEVYSSKLNASITILPNTGGGFNSIFNFPNETTYYLIKDSITNISYSNGTPYGVFSVTVDGNSSLVNTTYDYDNFTISGTGNVTRYWYADVRVVDSNSNGYTGATVTLYDQNGFLVFNGSSNGTGYLPRLNLREWVQTSGSRNVSSSHNFSAWIQNLNLQNSTTKNVSTNLVAGGAGEVVIQLGGFAPTPTPAPGAVPSSAPGFVLGGVCGDDLPSQPDYKVYALAFLLFGVGVALGLLSFKKREVNGE